MKKLFLVLLLFLLSACSGFMEKKEEGFKKVAILKLGTHELIDQVEVAIIKKLKEKYGDGVEISQYNGNFQQETIRQSVIQIIHSNVDLAIPITTSATSELVNASNGSHAIIFSFVSNPEEVWGKERNRPDYVSGTSDQLDYEKNVDLIMRLFPNVKTIGYLVNESEPNARDGLVKMKKLAVKKGFSLSVAGVSTPADVMNASRAIVSSVDVFLVGGDNTVVGGLGALLTVAGHANVPVFAVENTSVKDGALAAYGVDYNELGVATANMAISVLEGVDPGEMPVNYFSKTKLYVNSKAAKKFGVEAELISGAIEY